VSDGGVCQLIDPYWVGVGPKKIGPHSGGVTGSFGWTSVLIAGGVNASAGPLGTAVRPTNISGVTFVKSAFGAASSALVGAADSLDVVDVSSFAEEQETAAANINAAAITAVPRRRLPIATMSPRLPHPGVESNDGPTLLRALPREYCLRCRQSGRPTRQTRHLDRSV
jgi:hypothetical protein